MRSVELFAGAGGLGIGAAHASFHTEFVLDWDKWACDTLRENKKRGLKPFSDWEIVHGDVRKQSFAGFEGRLDLITGGPPCQPFSLGGRHRAYRDDRDMFPEAVRAVREAKPRAFVFENVKGLTRASFNRYFEYIRLQLKHPEVVRRANDEWTDHLKTLEEFETSGADFGLTYNVVTRVLNAADFGVSQKRERVFFVGFRADLGIDWSFPKPTHSAEALLWEQYRTGEYWEHHKVPRSERPDDERLVKRALKLDAIPETDRWQTVRDAINDLPDPETNPRAKGYHDHRFIAGARSYPGHTGSPFDAPAKTLKAGVHGVPGGENMLRRSDGSVRYFTVRESARLQTFPDDMRFHGSWTETMRQLGNAVPCRLAKTVISAVAAPLARVNRAATN